MSRTAASVAAVWRPHHAPGANTNNHDGQAADSLWNSSSPVYGNGSEGADYDYGFGYEYDDLTLPPINPDADAEDNYHLPPVVNNPQFFGIGQQRQRSLSPNQGFANLSSSTSASRSREQQDLEPPPSNQQARREHQQFSQRLSQYAFAELGSPELFDDPFFEIPGLPELSPPHSSSPTPRSPNTTRRSSIVDLTSSSPTDKMAPARKRKAEDAGSQSGNTPKAARGPAAKRRRSNTKREQSLGDVEVVDLADVETDQQFKDLAAKQQAEMIKKQQLDEAARPVRLADFNCIICMDNPTGLTVTHCGHLFCSECLHQALHAGDKKACPVCRTTISTTMTGRGGHKRQPKNGIFVLEMKLMTATRKGKRPAKASR